MRITSTVFPHADKRQQDWVVVLLSSTVQGGDAKAHHTCADCKTSKPGRQAPLVFNLVTAPLRCQGFCYAEAGCKARDDKNHPVTNTGCSDPNCERHCLSLREFFIIQSRDKIAYFFTPGTSPVVFNISGGCLRQSKGSATQKSPGRA